jgi:hypothetical protein
LTKTELVELVDRVYATWNQVVPQSSAKVIYEAWWRLLSDLRLEDCHRSLDSLAIADSYMPRPGALRKYVVLQDQNKQYGLAPQPAEAWATLQAIGGASARGEYVQVHLHPCVQKAVALLGGTAALALHTNGDRNSFTEVYKEVLEAWEIELAQLPSNETSGK